MFCTELQPLTEMETVKSENLIVLDAAIEPLQTIIMFLIDEGAIEKNIRRLVIQSSTSIDRKPIYTCTCSVVNNFGGCTLKALTWLGCNFGS